MRGNIILITIDSLRADALTPKVTPNLLKFSKESIMFTQAISQGPYTTVSIPSILTGKYPSHLQLTRGKLYGHLIPKGDSRIAKLLKEEGYTTVAFHSNPLLSRIFGYQEGFDYFYDDFFYPNVSLSNKVRWLINRIRRIFRIYPYLIGEKLTQRVLDRIRRISEPFFLWIHYMDPHGPYFLHRGFMPLGKYRSERIWRKANYRSWKLNGEEKAFLKKAYLTEVNYLDKQIGRLFRGLYKMQKMENSLLIITADHGESFGEHGLYSHPHYLYQELIHVPLFIYSPEIKPRRVSKPIELLNIFPTILDYVGIRDEIDYNGKSLMDLMETGNEVYLSDYVISEAEFSPYKGMIRKGRWKFILDKCEDREELFDLERDREEKVNLVNNYPSVVKELREKLNLHILSFKDVTSLEIDEGKTIDEKIFRSKLQSLGYID